jgi:hypothetical protein
MTAPNEPTLDYGLRFANIFELDENGLPAATNATPYEGYQIKGSTTFDLSIPDARKITGLGEDGITQVVYLPPNEGATGVLNAESADPILAALLDGTLVITVGDMTMVGVGTNRQGFEPRCGLLLYQAARGLQTGKSYWHSYFMPSAQLIRKAHGMNGDKGTSIYQIAPNRTGAHLWGTEFSVLVEGFVSAQLLEAWTNNPIILTTFIGDNTEDEFSFPVEKPSVNATPVVFVDGVKQTITTAYTATTTKITFQSGHIPGAGAVICVLRETAG